MTEQSSNKYKLAIKRYDLARNIEKVKRLISSKCNPDEFTTHYSCDDILSFSPPKEPDMTYIAQDKLEKGKNIAGFINVATIMLDGKLCWILQFMTSRAFINPKYKGVGGILIDYVMRDMAKNRVNYMLIAGYTVAGLGLYLKSGFKICSSQGYLCYSRDGSNIHPNMLRDLDIINLDYTNEYRKGLKLKPDKLDLTAKQDTLTYRRKVYGSPYIQGMNTKTRMPVYFPLDKSMIAGPDVLKEIRAYPDRVYR